MKPSPKPQLPQKKMVNTSSLATLDGDEVRLRGVTVCGTSLRGRGLWVAHLGIDPDLPIGVEMLCLRDIEF